MSRVTGTSCSGIHCSPVAADKMAIMRAQTQSMVANPFAEVGSTNALAFGKPRENGGPTQGC